MGSSFFYMEVRELAKHSLQRGLALYHQQLFTSNWNCSVAEIAEKPLYRVTCGDIGTSADAVEKYLETVLYLGKIWDCGKLAYYFHEPALANFS